MEVIKNENTVTTEVVEEKKVVEEVKETKEEYKNPFSFKNLVDSINLRTQFCLQYNTTILLGEAGIKYFFEELSKLVGKEFKPVNQVIVLGILMTIKPFNIKGNKIVVFLNNIEIEEYTF